MRSTSIKKWTLMGFLSFVLLLPGLAAAAPRDIDEFVRHVQSSARAMLRKDL